MKKLLIILVTLLLPLCFTLNALAAGEAADLNKKGSITVEFRCSHGFGGGGTATLYRVADLTLTDSGYSFVYTEDFVGCGFALDDISDDMNAGKFAKYVEYNGIKGNAIEIGDGVAKFDDLPVGLYLILHENNSDEFTDALPFLEIFGRLYRNTRTERCRISHRRRISSYALYLRLRRRKPNHRKMRKN